MIIEKYAAVLVAAILLTGVAACGRPPQAASRAQKLSAIGTEVVTQLTQGEYQNVIGRFDHFMQTSLTPDRLHQHWNELIQQVGPFQRQVSVKQEEAQQVNIVVVTCAFQKSTVNVRLAFNSQDQIIGLYFTPTASRS